MNKFSLVFSIFQFFFFHFFIFSRLVWPTSSVQSTYNIQPSALLFGMHTTHRSRAGKVGQGERLFCIMIFVIFHIIRFSKNIYLSLGLKPGLRHFGKYADRAGRVGKSGRGTAAGFNLSSICGCLLFLERRLETSPFIWSCKFLFSTFNTAIN